MLNSTQIIEKAKEHKDSIGGEKPRCDKCKYFVVDEGIDPNRHFGFCDVTDDEVKQIVHEATIITISDFCSKFREAE